MRNVPSNCGEVPCPPLRSVNVTRVSRSPSDPPEPNTTSSQRVEDPILTVKLPLPRFVSDTGPPVSHIVYLPRTPRGSKSAVPDTQLAWPHCPTVPPGVAVNRPPELAKTT